MYMTLLSLQEEAGAMKGDFVLYAGPTLFEGLASISCSIRQLAFAQRPQCSPRGRFMSIFWLTVKECTSSYHPRDTY